MELTRGSDTSADESRPSRVACVGCAAAALGLIVAAANTSGLALVALAAIVHPALLVASPSLNVRETITLVRQKPLW